METKKFENNELTDLSRFIAVRTDVFGKLNKDHGSFPEPEERSGHRMLSDSDYLYVIGGFSSSPSAHLFEEIWRFNLLCDTWEKVDISCNDFPHEMASFALCADGPSGSKFSRAFMFGGTTFPFGEEPSNRVHALERLQNGLFLWRQLNTTGHVPIKQYGSTIVFHRGILYLIGGTTGHVFNSEVRSLSLNNRKEDGVCSETWEWKLLEDGASLTGRYRHESVVVGDDILIIGGGNTEWVADLDKIPSFDTRTNRFKTLFTYPDAEYGYPEGRMCYACVQYNGKIYILGGCSAVNPETQSVSLFDDVWELDFFTWKWRKMPTRLHAKMCFHGAAVTKDGCIYVFGGALDGRFRTRCNVLQRMWLRPPSLQYLAQRAVLRALPRLFYYTLCNLSLSDPQKLLRIAYGIHTGGEDEFISILDVLWYLKRKIFG